MDRQGSPSSPTPAWKSTDVEYALRPRAIVQVCQHKPFYLARQEMAWAAVQPDCVEIPATAAGLACVHFISLGGG